MTRRASQLGVYETYEEFHGRKSTMDELIADVAQFSQQSMLWVCAVMITGMQLWDRIDNQPAGVFDTLIKLYFDRPFHARLLAGFWGANPRKVLFHRRQILLIAKLSIKHGAKGSLDARVNAQLIGQTLLKANDQLSHGLLDERSLPKEGGFPTTREDLSKLVVEMLATGEDGSMHIPQMMTRSHLMLTRFIEELRGHSDWIDLAGEYETTTGLTLEEREAMIMAVHSRYGAQLSKDLYRDPGVLPLKEGNFVTTSVSRTKVSAFLSAVYGLSSLHDAPFSEYRELVLSGVFLEPRKLRQKKFEARLARQAHLDKKTIEENVRRHEESLPKGVGGFLKQNLSILAFLAIPQDAFALVLQCAAAHKINFMTLRGQKLRYGHGNIYNYSLQEQRDE